MAVIQNSTTSCLFQNEKLLHNNSYSCGVFHDRLTFSHMCSRHSPPSLHSPLCVISGCILVCLHVTEPSPNTHSQLTQILYHDNIRESVDSLCRDGADMPMPPYIGKAFTRTNFEDLTIVYESLCTQ